MYALKAIETKYHGPTNTRGSRHSAKAEGGHRIMVCAPMELGIVECHAYAAKQLAEKLGWTGRWYIGGTKAGYVFVCLPVSTLAATDGNSTFAFTVEEEVDINPFRTIVFDECPVTCMVRSHEHGPKEQE